MAALTSAISGIAEESYVPARRQGRKLVLTFQVCEWEVLTGRVPSCTKEKLSLRSALCITFPWQSGPRIVRLCSYSIDILARRLPANHQEQSMADEDCHQKHPSIGDWAPALAAPSSRIVLLSLSRFFLRWCCPVRLFIFMLSRPVLSLLKCRIRIACMLRVVVTPPVTLLVHLNGGVFIPCDVYRCDKRTNKTSLFLPAFCFRFVTYGRCQSDDES